METKSKNTGLSLPDGVTQELVDAWKKKHGADKVKLATLSDADESFEPFDVVVCVPSRNVVSQFQKWFDNNPGKAQDILINNCLLTDKEKVKSNDAMYSAAMDGLTKLIPTGQATIKNL